MGRDFSDAPPLRKQDILPPCPCGNHEGEILDSHALRHTCGAWMAIANVPCKTVQAVMRHSTITLTMDTYGHQFPGQEADAVGRLPEMFRRRVEGEGGNAA